MQTIDKFESFVTVIILAFAGVTVNSSSKHLKTVSYLPPLLVAENQYGCVAVWEADYPQVLKTLADNSNKRRQLLEKLLSQN